MGCAKSNKSRKDNSYEDNSKGKTSEHRHPTQSGGIRNMYAFKELLGAGQFGKVMLGHNVQEDKTHNVAVKIVNMSQIPGKLLDSIKRETNILQGLDHPNIVKYYETITGSEYLYIIMEYCSGGMLFDQIKKKDRFSEREAGHVMSQLLRAISHCHSNGITHRDIKPENIMYASTDPQSDIKLIDFGFSKGMEKEIKRGGGITRPTRHLSHKASIIGTPYYVAPEVVTGFYSDKCDIWSIGVVLYVLLSGFYPFSGPDIIEQISEHKVTEFLEREWKLVSRNAKDLITHMLDTNVERRFSAEECLEHSWLKGLASSLEEGEHYIDLDVLNSIRNIKGSNQFQKEVMNNLVKNLQNNEIKDLTNQFKLIDKEFTGYITCDELMDLLNKSTTAPVSKKRVQEIIESIDYYGNHKINYSEFIAATLDAKAFLTHEKLWILFKHYDTNNNNLITTEGLRLALNHSGARKSKLEVKNMINENNPKRRGTLDYGEFSKMMKKYMLHHTTNQQLETLVHTPTSTLHK